MSGHIKPRTRPDGRKVWRARMPDPSRPAASGAKVERTFARKQDAERWLSRQTGAVDQGTYISTSAGATTLAVVADEWRATWDVKPLAPLTQRDYASILSRHVLPRWGSTKVAAIDAASIQEWIATDLADLHPETVFHVYGVLRGCLKTAVQRHYINTNPATSDAITLPSKKRARATQPAQLALTADELRQLAHAMPTPTYKLAVEIAGLLGLRAGELWGLTRADIDPLHNRLRVRYAIKDVSGRLIAGPTKTHEQRSLSVPASLRGALEAQLALKGTRLRPTKPGIRSVGYPCITDAGELAWTADANDPTRLLFTTRGGRPVQHQNVYPRIYRPAVLKLWPEPHRLSQLRFHDLRHTSASLLMTLPGANLALVQKRLGHSSITTTFDRYSHLLPGADASLSDALGAMYDDAADASKVLELPTKDGQT